MGAFVVRRSWAGRALGVAVIAQILVVLPFYFDGNYPGGGGRFFCDVLGAKLSDRIITRIGGAEVRITFLHFNERHHSIALGAGLPKHLHHFMLQLNDLRDLGRALDRVVDHGVRVVQTLGQHPNDKMISFYAETPSGFEVELGWGGRTITSDWQPETHAVWTEWGHRPPTMQARSGRAAAPR